MCSDGIEDSDVKLFLLLPILQLLNGACLYEIYLLNPNPISKNLVYVYVYCAVEQEGRVNRAFTSSHRAADEESQRGASAGPRRKKIARKTAAKPVG